MNEYVMSALLGVVEGVTEFLPVSSTAHLRIAEALLHISLTDPFWKMYSVVIQLGAILSLPIYFRERILGFIRTFPRGEKGDRTALTHPIGLTLVAFVTTAVPAFLLAKVIGKNLESLTIISLALMVGGVVMLAIDVMASRPRTTALEEMSLGQAIWIGGWQIVSAVFPGTSRSMSTIAAGQLTGMSRSAALEFSFLLSMPTMAAATGYDLLKLVTGDGLAAAGVNAHGWGLLAVGFLVSFVVAYASVTWFMAYVRRRGFVPFAIYRIIAGLAVMFAF